LAKKKAEALWSLLLMKMTKMEIGLARIKEKKMKGFWIGLEQNCK